LQSSELHHRSQYLAGIHLVECRLDIGDADAFGYELVQGQPALFIEVDEHREIALGQAVAVPGGLEPAAATEHIGPRNGELHLRGGHAHQHDGAGEVTTVEGLPPGLRAADGVDDHIGSESAGALLDRAHDLVLAHALRVDDISGSEVLRPIELLLVDVQGDDRPGTGQSRTGDRGTADSAAADDGHGLAAGDLTGVDGRTGAGHDTAADQPDDSGVGFAELRARPHSHAGRLGEGADAQRRFEFGAVGQGHLLRSIVGVEAVPGLTALAGTAVTADGAPVEDDEVADLDARDAFADLGDDAGGFMTEQEREAIADSALTVVEVGVADAARLHIDDDLSRTGLGEDDVGEFDWYSSPARDDALGSLWHCVYFCLRRRVPADAGTRSGLSAPRAGRAQSQP